MKRLNLLLLLACTVSASGQTGTSSQSPFADTIDWSAQSVEEARDELKTVRARIAAEQKPQLETLTSLQSNLLVLRRERELLTSETEGMRHQVERLSERVRLLADTNETVQHRLLHIRRKFEEHLQPIERSLYRDSFLALEEKGTGSSADRLEAARILFAIANAAIDRLDAQIGGHRYLASARVDGVLTTGTALQVGPYAFFAPEEGRPGLIVEDDDLVPYLRYHTPETEATILMGMSGQEALLPFDPLLDRAYLNLDAKVSLWNHLKSGGIWIIPITIFGLLSMVIAVLKLIQIQRIRVPGQVEVQALVEARDEAAFQRQLQTITPHARPIFAEGFVYRNAPESARAAAMSQVLLGFRHRVDSGLSLLGLTAAVAPLLGLLGTVTGMIKTFQVISLYGAGDARALSGGISEALVTTEFGLIVAIPALLAHAWLNRRARRITIETTVLAERYNKTVVVSGEEP